MKYELKKLQVYPRISQETTAFNADLWIDGIKAAECSNEGHGGNNHIRFIDRDLEKHFYAWVKTLPNEPVYNLPMDGDLFITCLLDEAMKKKDLERHLKTKVLFRLPGDKKDEYRVVKFTPGKRDEALQAVRNKYPQIEELL
jgi:hypothetical protein